MEHTNEATVNMTSTQQKQESDASKRSTNMLTPRIPSLRPRSLLNINKSQSTAAKYNLEVLCNLLCKPVSVSLTKLSISELKNSSTKMLHQTQIKRKHRQKGKKWHFYVRKRCSVKKNTEVEQNQVSNSEDAEKNVHPKKRISRKRKISEDHKEETDLLQGIKQPHIKLQRIDKVITKIAQTFAKVISEKDATSDKATHVGETSGESNALTSQTLAVFTTTNNNTCLQNNETQNLMLESHINENIPANQHAEDSNSKMLKVNNKPRRRCRVIYDSDTDEDNNVTDILSEVIPREIQELESNSPKKVIQTFITDEKDNASCTLEESVVVTTSSNENVTVQVSSSQEVDTPEACNLADKRSSEDTSEYVNVASTLDNIPQKSDQVVERNKEDRASSCVPSEIHFIHTSEDTCPQLEVNSSVNLEEPTSMCNETQNQVHEPFISEEELVNKYKLFKDLKVFLIKLDSIKASLDNTYSATEIEQLMNKYITVSPDSKFRYTSPRALSSHSICLETVNQSDKLHHSVATSSICENNNSNACTVNEDVQNINEVSLNVCNKSPSCLSDKVQEQQKDSPKNQKDCSKERSEGISYQNSKSKSSPVRALPSPRKSVAKGLNFSNRIKNAVNTQKSACAVNKSPVIKSCSELLSSASKGTTLRKLSFSENSEQTIANLGSSENTDVKECKEIVPAIVAAKNNLNDESVSNGNEKVLISGKRVRVIKLHLKPINKSSLKLNGNKNNVGITSSMPSPIKQNIYKCIVCDSCFGDYSLLQQHLPTHRQKQNVVSTDIPLADTVPLEENSVVEKQEETVSSELKTEEPQPKRSQQTTSKSTNNNKDKASLQKEAQKKGTETKDSSANKRKTGFPSKRIKFPKTTNYTNECSICSQVFPTKNDLAAHIFLHTESELLRAYENAKQKMKEADQKEREAKGQKAEQTTTEESVTKGKKNATYSVIDYIEESIIGIKTNKESGSELSTTLQNDRSLTAHSEPEVTNKTEANDSVEARKSTISNESVSNETQVLSVQNDMEKDRTSKTVHNKKGYVVCQCHNRSGINDNCLQIEIVLLCHTCRVLFRTMECFETHYRFPEFALCNQNRLESGRSPNLFCATCGMIFSSVEEVRHHLQTHARFQQNFTTDFRCNICKVVFFGIGTLFYTHWSKHAKDAFWVASEQSFPKSSIIKSKSGNVSVPVTDRTLTSNKSTGTYIQVAEHICYNCKMPFATEDYLKKHESKCKVTNSVKDTAAQQTTVRMYGKCPAVCLTCSLCDNIFLEKIEFYRHMRDIHNFVPKPKLVCVSLTTIRRAFICTVCMDITEDIIQFEEHWLKHSTNQPCFGCTYCKKDFDNLKFFLEHIKEHESRIKEGTVSCTVTYRKAKFICTPCNFGFASQDALNEHNVIHNKKILYQGNSASVSESNNISNLPKSNELIVERQKERSVEEQVNTCVNTQTVKKATENSTKCDRDIEKEKLINILEGNEDSENELTIDLTEHSKENNELQREEENKEKRLLPAPTSEVLTTVETSVASENCKADMHVNKAVHTSQNSAPNLEASGNHEQILHANLNSSNNTQANLPENKEKLTKPQRSSPTKPKQGFLRVKNLAELISNPDCLTVCEFCGRTFENNEHWRQHVSTHTASNQATVQSSQQTKGSVLSTQILNKPSAFPASQKPRTMEKQAAQSHAVLVRNQLLQQSTLSSTSAYHKNLPACNIVQKSVAVPRSSVQKSEKTPAKVIVNSSNVQNIQAAPATSYSTAEHPVIHNSSKHPPTVNGVTNSNATAFNTLCSLLKMNYQVHSNDSQINNTCKTSTNTQPVYKEQNIEPKAMKSHNVVGNPAVTASNVMSNNQNYKQPQMQQPSLTGFYQRPNISTNNLSNNNQRPMQNQQMSSNQPNTTAPSFYYKNSTTGGMSIVINQTTPTVQAMPTTGTLPGQGQQQALIYQPFVYSNPVTHLDPYMQQPQNINNLSGLGGIYSMTTTPYEVPVGGTLTTYEVMMQAAEGLVCPYCPNAVPFMSEELLQLHVDSAHNYECDICSQRFYHFNELSLHRVKHRFMNRDVL